MSSKSDPTVFIVDDDVVLCKGLGWLLDSVNIQSEAFHNGQDFLDAYDSKRKGCILLDLRMPKISGLEVQERLNAQNNNLPIIMLTGHGDIALAVQSMKAGAFDFITKPFNDHLLVEQIQRAITINAAAVMSVQYADLKKRLDLLTPREREIMERVVNGRLNKQIAHELGISLKTVELHRSHMMHKMQTKSLAELVKISLTLQVIA